MCSSDLSLTRVGSDWYKVADIDWNQHIYLSHAPGRYELSLFMGVYNVNKAELIEAVAASADLSKVAAARAVEDRKSVV